MEDLYIEAGDYIRKNRELHAESIIDLHTSLLEEKSSKKRQSDLELYHRGILFNLSFLAESISFSEPAIYDSALDWGKKYLTTNNVTLQSLIDLQDTIKKFYQEEAPPDINKIITDHIEDSFKILQEAFEQDQTRLNKDSTLHKESIAYLNSLLNAEKESAYKLIMNLLDKGTSIKDIYLQIFEPVQKELGVLWQKGKISVAQEHYSTAVTQLIMSRLYDYLFEVKKNNNIFIGACTKGELHEIGLRMISDLLELNGWNTYFLGANVPPDGIIEILLEKEAEVIGLSATMSYNLSEVRKVIELIRSSKECKDLKIIVGGNAFNSSEKIWKKTGADYYASGAEEAVSLICNIV
jgi:methanogenic corrinoid protein MtbC1